MSVYFTADGQRGWAVGQDGTVLATQNGGESWQAQTSGTTKLLNSVYFASDGQRGWAVGQDGTVLATQNGGESWQTRTSGTTKWLTSDSFAGDGQRGWAVGQDGTVLATQNGGESWQAQKSGINRLLNSVYFAGDGQRGWAVGQDGTVLATQNGGESWQAQTSRTNKLLNSVSFAGDGQRGWAVGEDGTILATQNGGESWQAQTGGTIKSLTSVYFAADGQRGWAVGKDGTVLRLNPVNLTALNAAVNLKGVTTALAAARINEQVIGQPLDTLRALEGNRDTLRAQIAQEDTEIQKRKDALPNVFSTKLDPLELFVFITKFALLIVLFFLVNILVSVYRYSQRLAAQYDAQAYALGLSNVTLDPNFHRLVRTLTPRGLILAKSRGPPPTKFSILCARDCANVVTAS